MKVLGKGSSAVQAIRDQHLADIVAERAEGLVLWDVPVPDLDAHSLLEAPSPWLLVPTTPRDRYDEGTAGAGDEADVVDPGGPDEEPPPPEPQGVLYGLVLEDDFGLVVTDDFGLVVTDDILA